ncbi:MAG: iron-sulfur cluster insertion protein ErpA [Candidatus Sedimenticola endophacoides]
MLTLTENAQKAVDRFIQSSETPVEGLRVSVSGGGCSGFQYGMALEANPNSDDMVLEMGSIKVFVDPVSSQMLQGVVVDFIDDLEGSGFKFENPNATKSCGCGNSFSC